MTAKEIPSMSWPPGLVAPAQARTQGLATPIVSRVKCFFLIPPANVLSADLRFLCQTSRSIR